MVCNATEKISYEIFSKVVTKIKKVVTKFSEAAIRRFETAKVGRFSQSLNVLLGMVAKFFGNF